MTEAILMTNQSVTQATSKYIHKHNNVVKLNQLNIYLIKSVTNINVIQS